MTDFAEGWCCGCMAGVVATYVMLGGFKCDVHSTTLDEKNYQAQI